MVDQRPVTYISANPRITPSVTRKTLVDCVPCYNTKNYQYGENCNTLVDIYADMLANLSISMRSNIHIQIMNCTESRIGLMAFCQEDAPGDAIFVM